MTGGVCPQVVGIELAAADDHRLVVGELVAPADEPLLHDGIMPRPFQEAGQSRPAPANRDLSPLLLATLGSGGGEARCRRCAAVPRTRRGSPILELDEPQRAEDAEKGPDRVEGARAGGRRMGVVGVVVAVA